VILVLKPSERIGISGLWNGKPNPYVSSHELLNLPGERRDIPSRQVGRQEACR